MTFTSDPKYGERTTISIEKDEKIEDYFKRMKRLKIEHPEKKYAEKFKCITSDSFEKYPDELFPEILLNTAKNDSSAYLISDFYFAKDSIEIDVLCSMLEQYEVTKDKLSKCNYCSSQGKHRIICFKNVDTNKFKSESKGITFIIAKLKYPYIAKLKSNLMKDLFKICSIFIGTYHICMCCCFIYKSSMHNSIINHLIN